MDAARHHAERALAELARVLGSRADDLVVIGGLNAELLTDPPDAPHRGTVDVDLLVQLAVVYDRDEQDFGWLERGLLEAGFRTRGTGWRWWRDVGGVPVKVELLCDVYDNPGREVALPGCAVASAQNLRGPGAALAQRTVRRVAVEQRDGVMTVELQFASLGGYLLAKAAAAFDRGLDKDFYDLAFHLLYNKEGGPAAAGRAVRAASDDEAAEYARIFLAVLAMFDDPAGPAARAYAELRAQDGVTMAVDLLAQDAAAAARACRDAFLSDVTDRERP